MAGRERRAQTFTDEFVEYGVILLVPSQTMLAQNTQVQRLWYNSLRLANMARMTGAMPSEVSRNLLLTRKEKRYHSSLYETDINGRFSWQTIKEHT